MSASAKANYSKTFTDFDESKLEEFSLKLLIFSSTLSVLYVKDNTLLKVEKFSWQKTNAALDASAFKNILTEIPSCSYQAVELIYSGLDYVLIPKKIFKSDSVTGLFNFLTTGQPKMQFENYSLTSMEAIAAYALQQNIIDECKTKFSNFKITHFSSLLIDYLMPNNKNIQSYVHIRVSDQSFECALVKNSKLEFFNQFSFKTIEEFAFYLLSVFNTFSLNNLEFPVQVSGAISPDSKIVDVIKKYFGTLTFVQSQHRNIAQDLSLQSFYPLLEELKIDANN